MIRLTLVEVPRTTTREEWREMDRTRRIWERMVRQKLEENAEAIDKAVMEMSIYGSARLEIK